MELTATVRGVQHIQYQLALQDNFAPTWKDFVCRNGVYSTNSRHDPSSGAIIAFKNLFQVVLRPFRDALQRLRHQTLSHAE